LTVRNLSRRKEEMSPRFEATTSSVVTPEGG